MPLDGEDITQIEGDREKHVYTVKFSNGAYQQLTELAAFLDTENLLDVVKSGISLVELAKELELERARIESHGS